MQKLHTQKRSLMMAAAVLALTGAPATAAIIIVDPSFELNNIAANGASQSGYATVSNGWTGGTAYLVDNTSTTQWFNQAVPDGQQAVSLAYSFVTQQLNDSVNGAVMTGASAQQFNISFFAGWRKEQASAASFSVILQAYNGNTYVGNLASQMFYLGANDSNSATTDLGIAQGNWTSSAVNVTLTAAAGQFAGNNIRVVFAQNTPFGSGSTGEAAIDNVSVTAVPEPASALLFGCSAFALLRRRRA